jgi:oligoribonuclease
VDRYQSNLVWIDLEMTGLELPDDTILEIATVVTTNDLDIIGYGPALVIHQPDAVLERMDEWNQKYHTSSGLVDQVRASTITLEQAQEQTLVFLKQYCAPGVSPLCGNSVWQDRAFLRAYMPRLNEFLNYRIIDVSSIKEVVRRWYGKTGKAKFAKPENHRALEDILQSVAELHYYKDTFFKVESDLNK